MREAVINAIVHNDYSFEVPPKFEIFPDRLEITSAGRLPESLTREEFFNGISIPRNKELMRIYRDVELLMKALSRHQDGTKSVLDIEDIDKLLIFCEEVRTIAEMLSYMNYSDRTKFRKKYIYPLLDAEIIQMTIPNKPNSRNQKYQLTAKGLELIEHLKGHN